MKEQARTTDGIAWELRSRNLPWRPELRADTPDLDLPDLGGDDLIGSVLLIIGFILLVFVLFPVLMFGAEALLVLLLLPILFGLRWFGAMRWPIDVYREGVRQKTVKVRGADAVRRQIDELVGTISSRTDAELATRVPEPLKLLEAPKHRRST